MSLAVRLAECMALGRACGVGCAAGRVCVVGCAVGRVCGVDCGSVWRWLCSWLRVAFSEQSLIATGLVEIFPAAG